MARCMLGPRVFGSTLACLGTHFALLVRHVDEVRPGLQWYVADVFPEFAGLPCQRHTPQAVGDSDTFARALDAAGQFESGVFVGAPGARGAPRWRNGGLWTEDEDTADLGGATVELRAFDTSYILCLSEDRTLLSLFEELGRAAASRTLGPG